MGWDSADIVLDSVSPLQWLVARCIATSVLVVGLQGDAEAQIVAQTNMQVSPMLFCPFQRLTIFEMLWVAAFLVPFSVDYTGY